jgi:hypothetical protein
VRRGTHQHRPALLQHRATRRRIQRLLSQGHLAAAGGAQVASTALPVIAPIVCAGVIQKDAAARRCGAVRLRSAMNEYSRMPVRTSAPAESKRPAHSPRGGRADVPRPLGGAVPQRVQASAGIAEMTSTRWHKPTAPAVPHKPPVRDAGACQCRHRVQVPHGVRQSGSPALGSSRSAAGQVTAAARCYGILQRCSGTFATVGTDP